MPRRSRFTLALAIAMALSMASATAALAATETYLTVPGYATTTNEDPMSKIAGTMEIDDWSFEIRSNANPTLSRTATPPKSTFGAFHFSKAIDQNSGRIALSDLPKGTLFKSVKVTATKTTGESAPQPYLKYCFTDAVFTSYSAAYAEEVPKDSVTMAYGSMTTSFSPQGAGGNLLTPVKAGWNLIGNVVAGTTVLANC